MRTRLAALLLLVPTLVAAQPAAGPPLPVTVEGSYVFDVAGPVSGDAVLFGQGLFDLVFGYEADGTAGRLGVVADLQAHHGIDPSVHAGDVQAFDNQAATGFERIAELFVEWEHPGHRLRVRAGKFDANGEFAAPDNSGDFVNSSMGFSPAIAGMSTYPENGLGAAVAADVPGIASLKVGLFDMGERTSTDGLEASFAQKTWMLEAGRAWVARGGGRVALGAWRTDLADAPDDALEGLYATFDQTVWAPPGDTEGRGVSVYAQWAGTRGELVEIDRHVGAGLLWTGPSSSRPADAVGLGVSRAGLVQAHGFTAQAETAVEAFYRVAVSPMLSIQPDVQLVLDPGGDASADAVVAATLRVIATY